MLGQHLPSRPQVIQGNFQGRTPTVVIQPKARAFASRQLAPHVQAAIQRNINPHHWQPALHQQPVAQMRRQGHAFEVPHTFQFKPSVMGRRLPVALQQKMEQYFGADFSDVRVHIGPQAQQIGALAFTMGPNIYFAPGQYDPQSTHGQRLIGHELAHVVQQRSGRVHNPFGSDVAVVQEPHLEQEADRMGMQAALMQPNLLRPDVIQLVGEMAYAGQRQTDLLTAAWANIQGLATDADTAKETEDDLAERVTPSNDLNCTAVVEKDNLYHIAMNTYKGRQLEESGIDSDYRVYKGDGTIHAEMILLDALDEDFGYVGISKKCCLLCAATLTLAGIQYRGCHWRVFNTGWKPPEFLSTDEDMLKSFIGDAAWAIYDTLAEAGQREFRNDLFMGAGHH